MSRPCVYGLSVSAFYNLFLGCGMIVGVIAWMSGNVAVGRTLVIYICLFMVLGGDCAFHLRPVGLWWRGRQEHRRRAWPRALPPLVALVAALA